MIAILVINSPGDIDVRCRGQMKDIRDTRYWQRLTVTMVRDAMDLAYLTGQRTGPGTFIDDLLERRKLAGITSSRLITNPDGVRLSYAMLRNRWQESRAAAMQAAIDAGDSPLAHRIKQFRFSDIQPKAASEIDDLTDASKLLGHSKEQITKTVYRRVGEVVSPTR